MTSNVHLTPSFSTSINSSIISTRRKKSSIFGNEGDLNRLKATATKLNLKTRRQSYLTWRAKYVDQTNDLDPEVKAEVKGQGKDEGKEKLTKERKERMDEALDWIKKQLVCYFF